MTNTMPQRRPQAFSSAVRERATLVTASVQFLMSLDTARAGALDRLGRTYDHAQIALCGNERGLNWPTYEPDAIEVGRLRPW